jgi:uncharacterized protein YegP (UPF0339 family)
MINFIMYFRIKYQEILQQELYKSYANNKNQVCSVRLKYFEYFIK